MRKQFDSRTTLSLVRDEEGRREVRTQILVMEVQCDTVSAAEDIKK